MLHSSAVLDRDLGADGCRATGLCSCYMDGAIEQNNLFG